MGCGGRKEKSGGAGKKGEEQEGRERGKGRQRRNGKQKDRKGRNKIRKVNLGNKSPETLST